MKTLLSMILTVAASVASAAVTTNYVNCAYKGGDSDGSKDKPWATIEAALTAVAAKSDVVLIAPGYYRPTTPLSTKKTAVKIYGDSNNPRDIVIDGGDVRARLLTVPSMGVIGCLTVTNAYGGVFLGSGAITNCVVTGCVISNLLENGTCDVGAGISIKPGTNGAQIKDTTVENCRIELWGSGCSDVRGGGICVNLEVSSTLTFDKVTVSNCALVVTSTASASGKILRGAGIDTFNSSAVLHWSNCRIVDNWASYTTTGWGSETCSGACLDEGSMTDCVVSGMRGLTILSAKDLSVTNCTFYGNDPSENGNGFSFSGASDIYGSLFEANTNKSNNVGLLTLADETKLHRSVLKGNVAKGYKYSGLVLSGKENLVEECVFEDSSTTSMGAALSASGLISGLVRNCVFRRHSADGNNGGSLFYGSTKSTGTAGDALVVRNCLFEGCVSVKNHSLFVTGAYANSRILFESCTFLTNSCTQAFMGCTSGRNYLDYTSFSNCLFVANTTGEGGSPTLSADNYWTDSLTAAKFADIGNGDLHPKSSSPAAKRGILRNWMEEEKDLGSLIWSRTAVGASVKRANMMSRVGRDAKIACGCFSALNPTGAVVIFR